MRAWMIIIGMMLLVGNVLAASTLPRYGMAYSLNFELADGKLTCPNWSLSDGDGRRYDVYEADGTHRLSAFDASGKELYTFRFYLFATPSYAAPRDFFDENGTQIKFKDDSDLPRDPRLRSYLYPPYHPNATRLEVSELNGTVLLEVDVSKYAHLDWQAIKRNRDEFYKNKANQTSGDANPPKPPVNWTNAFYGLLMILAAIALVLGSAIFLKNWMKKSEKQNDGKILKK